MSVREYAELLGVSRATVYKAIATGEIAHVRVSNVIRVVLDERAMTQGDTVQLHSRVSRHYAGACEHPMELLEIERRLLKLLGAFPGPVPPEQVQDMKELAAAGEPGVALENYCTQLFEFDASVPAEVLTEIQELGRAMGLDEKYWERFGK